MLKKSIVLFVMSILVPLMFYIGVIRTVRSGSFSMPTYEQILASFSFMGNFLSDLSNRVSLLLSQFNKVVSFNNWTFNFLDPDYWGSLIGIFYGFLIVFVQFIISPFIIIGWLFNLLFV